MIKTYTFEYRLNMNSDEFYEVSVQGKNEEHAIDLLFDHIDEFHNLKDEEERANVSISQRI